MEQNLLQTLIVSIVVGVTVFFLVLRGLLLSLNSEREGREKEAKQRRELQDTVAEQEAIIEAFKTKVTAQRDEITVLKHHNAEANSTISTTLQRTKVSTWQGTAVLLVVSFITALLVYQIVNEKRR